MGDIAITGLMSVFWWGLFFLYFRKDRSRYRNCYLLAIALASLFLFVLSAGGEYVRTVALYLIYAVLFGLLVVPVFFIYNGILMIIREGRHPAQLLSLCLGIVILLCEVLIFARITGVYQSGASLEDQIRSSTALQAAEILFCISVMYGAGSFYVFMLYTLFLQIIPIKKDFDYVIIHGSGLLDGNRVPKLLQDRLDKAIEVYRKDPTPPTLIPSGGQGEDESIPEAEAMRQYLISKGIPERDIIPETDSRTTQENIEFSKKILDQMDDRKYTALVTSNYHVYRALRYCKKAGLKCTGIGSHVALYFWPGALIREFIAIHAEKKHAVLFIAGWLVCISPMLLVLIGELFG